MMAIAKHSSVPLRIVIFLGLLSSLLSFISGVIYLIYKLLYWDSFSVGIGPLVIGMFFFFANLTVVFISLIDFGNTINCGLFEYALESNE